MDIYYTHTMGNSTEMVGLLHFEDDNSTLEFPIEIEDAITLLESIEKKEDIEFDEYDNISIYFSDDMAVINFRPIMNTLINVVVRFEVNDFCNKFIECLKSLK